MDGAHFVKVGEWIDDTAMTLAIAETILTEVHPVPNAITDDFVCRRADGEFISRGFCFDIRNTTRNALERFIAGAGNQ